MSTVQLTYDADKHGLSVKEPGHQSVAMGCTYHAPDMNDWCGPGLVARASPGVCCPRWACRQTTISWTSTVPSWMSRCDDNKPFPHMESITLRLQHAP